MIHYICYTLRSPTHLFHQHHLLKSIGYHYNLSIEDCARGILLMDELAKFGPINKDSVDNCAVTYPNLKTVTLKFTE